MTILKKGTCESSVTTSSMVYVCSGCGYTEMASSGDSGAKECPQCHSQMSIMSSNTEENPSGNISDAMNRPDAKDA